MKIWFTSDTHFFHDRIIGYCKRPFGSVEEMNRTLIERWQAVVGPQDRVYHLGDFAMGPKALGPHIVSQLPGYKILVAGNHDRSKSAMMGFGFDEVHDELRLDLDGHKLILHHEPLPFMGYDWKGAGINLCGHVHEKWSHRHWNGGLWQINVGVDVRNFRPTSLDGLLSSAGYRP